VLEKAKILIESGFGINHPSFLSVNEQLAVLAWNEGNIQLAVTAFIEVCQAKLDLIEKFFPSMSENEKSKFWAKSQSTFLKFYAFVSENYAQDSRLLIEMYNIQLATKGILLNTTSKVRQLILNSNNELLKADFASWINTKEQLANAYGLSK
jgi:hypothetical protein